MGLVAEVVVAYALPIALPEGFDAKSVSAMMVNLESYEGSLAAAEGGALPEEVAKTACSVLTMAEGREYPNVSYHDAVDSMDLHHVNHVDAEGRLPIAFSLYHYVNIHDATFLGITGELPISNDDWQQRVRVAIPDHGKNRPVSEMAEQRIGNYEAFKEYQRAVFDRTEHHLATMDAADFDRVIIAPPYPAEVANTYSARCAGPQGITVLDAFECWHYQHGLRHMGEIELARGFLGLGGMTA